MASYIVLPGFLYIVGSQSEYNMANSQGHCILNTQRGGHGHWFITLLFTKACMQTRIEMYQ